MGHLNFPNNYLRLLYGKRNLALRLGLGLGCAGGGAGLELGLSWGLGRAQAWLSLGWPPVLVGVAWGALVLVGFAKHCLGFFCFCF